MSKRTRAVIQWVMVSFILGAIGFALYAAKDDPRMDWGPVLLGFIGLLGFIVPGLFKQPKDVEDDGYESR